MNELKQMMLDLQKNETKESESYPNVSFMSTDNFEREKILSKRAICTIKRHERRRNRIQISDTSKTSQILN